MSICISCRLAECHPAPLACWVCETSDAPFSWIIASSLLSNEKAWMTATVVVCASLICYYHCKNQMMFSCSFWMLLLPWLSDPWSWSTYSYTTWTFSPFSSLSAWHANPPATEISRKLIYLELHKYLYLHMFSTHQYSLQIKATCQDDHGVRLVQRKFSRSM